MVWRISFDKNIQTSPLVIFVSHLNTEEKHLNNLQPILQYQYATLNVFWEK